MHMVMGLILAIGLCPNFFLGMLSEPLKLFTDKLSLSEACLDGYEYRIHNDVYWLGVQQG